MPHYGWLDKVMKVRDIDGMKGQDKTTSFSYHVDGQLAERSVGRESERFFWDGLALVRRNDTSYLNEPSVTGGNPILADDKVMFNDMLGNTLGIYGKDLQEVSRTSFGSGDETGFFTGKPYVKELGAVFLFRNYRSDLGKWQTADPLGYPDGWNNFAYCNNHFTSSIDGIGLAERSLTLGKITYTWDWQTAAISAISFVRDDPEFSFGTSATVTWTVTVNWICNKCKETGSFSISVSKTASAVDWTGINPASPGLSVPTFSTILQGLGVVAATALGSTAVYAEVSSDGWNNIIATRPSDGTPLNNMPDINHQCPE